MQVTLDRNNVQAVRDRHPQRRILSGEKSAYPRADNGATRDQYQGSHRSNDKLNNPPPIATQKKTIVARSLGCGDSCSLDLESLGIEKRPALHVPALALRRYGTKK